MFSKGQTFDCRHMEVTCIVIVSAVSEGSMYASECSGLYTAAASAGQKTFEGQPELIRWCLPCG